MNTVLVPTGLPASRVHTSHPSVPNHLAAQPQHSCPFTLFSAGDRRPENPARRQRDNFPRGSWPGLGFPCKTRFAWVPFGTALAGWPVGAAESGSRCVLSGMARGYGRVVQLRQLPTPCGHDAVAFGSRPVNDRPGGDFHLAEWTPSQAYECARLLALSDSDTAPADLPTHACPPQTTGLSGYPTTHTVGGTRFTPARGWVYPNRRPRPESRALCWSEPRERCGIARLCGASSPGRSKSEMRRAARGLRALSLRRGSPGENPWFQERKIRHTPAHATFLR